MWSVEEAQTKTGQPVYTVSRVVYVVIRVSWLFRLNITEKDPIYVSGKDFRSNTFVYCSTLKED